MVNGFMSGNKEIFTFDTEFIEDGVTIDLISIGILNITTGKELYLISSEYDESKADEWVKKNVLDKIGKDEKRHTKKEIKEEIIKFCGDKPEFWAYYASYDWIVFCQIFGKMLDLPKTYPKICLDIKQEIIRQGLTKEQLPPDPKNEHNALDDAKWNQKALMVLFPEGVNIQDGISEKKKIEYSTDIYLNERNILSNNKI